MGIDRVGTMAFPSLGLGLSARSAGMGQTEDTLEEGAHALSSNPAGMYKRIERTETKRYRLQGLVNYYSSEAGAATGRSLDFMPASAFNGTVVWQPGNSVAMGLGVSYFKVNGGEGRDTSGSLTGEEVGESDITVTFGVARDLDFISRSLRMVYLGANVKYISKEVVAKYTGVAFDVGTRIDLSESWSLGYCAQNLGKAVSEGDEIFDLPTAHKIGLSYSDKDVRCSLGQEILPDAKPVTALGLEYGVTENWVARFGYRYNWTEDPLGIKNFSLGVGYRKDEFSIDGAIRWTHSDMRPTVQFTVSYSLGALFHKEE